MYVQGGAKAVWGFEISNSRTFLGYKFSGKIFWIERFFYFNIYAEKKRDFLGF